MASVRLGKLESAIMDLIWKHAEPVTVPEVHRSLGKTRDLAYTSTMTVMSRLCEKGLLKRSEDRRPYTYWAALTREDYSAGLMVGVLHELGNRKAVLLRFVEKISREDAVLLRDLFEKAKRSKR